MERITKNIWGVWAPTINRYPPQEWPHTHLHKKTQEEVESSHSDKQHFEVHVFDVEELK